MIATDISLQELLTKFSFPHFNTIHDVITIKVVDMCKLNMLHSDFAETHDGS